MQIRISLIWRLRKREVLANSKQACVCVSLVANLLLDLALNPWPRECTGIFSIVNFLQCNSVHLGGGWGEEKERRSPPPAAQRALCSPSLSELQLHHGEGALECCPATLITSRPRLHISTHSNTDIPIFMHLYYSTWTHADIRNYKQSFRILL